MKETNELEKRANQAGVELVKAAEQLAKLRSDVTGMERKRGKQERLLRDVNQVNDLMFLVPCSFVCLVLFILFVGIYKRKIAVKS